MNLNPKSSLGTKQGKERRGQEGQSKGLISDNKAQKGQPNPLSAGLQLRACGAAGPHGHPASTSGRGAGIRGPCVLSHVAEISDTAP